MEKVALPAGLQILKFGGRFNHSMEKVALPAGLQRLTFGGRLYQGMEKVVLSAGLKRVTFGPHPSMFMDITSDLWPKVSVPENCTIYLES